MDIEIREFITYLHNTKKTSANTEISYQRDLKKMAEFLKERGIRNYKDVKELVRSANSSRVTPSARAGRISPR